MPFNGKLSRSLKRSSLTVQKISVKEKKSGILVGSCGGFVEIDAGELPSYYDGYRLVAIMAMVVAIPILWLIHA